MRTYAWTYVICGDDPQYAEDRCRDQAMKKIIGSVLENYDFTTPIAIRFKEERQPMNYGIGPPKATEVKLSLDITQIPTMNIRSCTFESSSYESKSLWRIAADRTKIKCQKIASWFRNKFLSKEEK